jgi:plasmid stabilization system protein ParE
VAVEVRWSKDAREDLLRLHVAIGLDSPRATERIYGGSKSMA